MARIFLSYARKDGVEAVASLARAIENVDRYWTRIPVHKPFYDKDSLHAGVELGPGIKRALYESDLLVVMAGRHTAESEWVAEETRTWLNHLERPDRRLVVVRAHSAVPKLGVDDARGRPAYYDYLPDVFESRTNRLALDLISEEGESGTLIEEVALELCASASGESVESIRTRRTRNRRRRQVVAASALALVLLALVFAYSQYRDRRVASAIATSRSLVADSQAAARVDPERAALSAVDAFDAYPTESASTQLLSLAIDQYWIEEIVGQLDDVSSIVPYTLVISDAGRVQSYATIGEDSSLLVHHPLALADAIPSSARGLRPTATVAASVESTAYCLTEQVADDDTPQVYWVGRASSMSGWSQLDTPFSDCRTASLGRHEVIIAMDGEVVSVLDPLSLTALYEMEVANPNLDAALVEVLAGRLVIGGKGGVVVLNPGGGHSLDPVASRIRTDPVRSIVRTWDPATIASIGEDARLMEHNVVERRSSQPRAGDTISGWWTHPVQDLALVSTIREGHDLLFVGFDRFVYVSNYRSSDPVVREELFDPYLRLDPQEIRGVVIDEHAATFSLLAEFVHTTFVATRGGYERVVARGQGGVGSRRPFRLHSEVWRGENHIARLGYTTEMTGVSLGSTLLTIQQSDIFLVIDPIDGTTIRSHQQVRRVADGGAVLAATVHQQSAWLILGNGSIVRTSLSRLRELVSGPDLLPFLADRLGSFERLERWANGVSIVKERLASPLEAVVYSGTKPVARIDLRESDEVWLSSSPMALIQTDGSGYLATYLGPESEESDAPCQVAESVGLTVRFECRDRTLTAVPPLPFSRDEGVVPGSALGRVFSFVRLPSGVGVAIGTYSPNGSGQSVAEFVSGSSPQVVVGAFEFSREVLSVDSVRAVVSEDQLLVDLASGDGAIVAYSFAASPERWAAELCSKDFADLEC